MKIRRVLIVNTFGIGDVLFTTPLIHALNQHNPDIFIGYVANRRTAGVLSNHPLLDRVYVYERDEFKEVSQASRWKYFKKIKDFIAEIKANRYEMVLDLSLNRNFGFLSALAGIHERVGLDFKNRGTFLTKKVPIKGYEGKHVVEYYLDLLRQIGIQPQAPKMEIPLTVPDLDFARDLFEQRQLSVGTVVALVPGGGASWGKDAAFKRWPLPRFAKLADKLVANFKAKVILLGNKQEEELCRTLQNLVPEAINLCGKTSIAQSAAVFGRCDAVIANDGGPLHMAVAAGARTVSIFGPVDPQVYGPYPPDGHRVVTANVACRPCYRRFRRAQCDHVSCLSLIGVEDVYKAAEDILNSEAKAPGS